MKRSEVLIRVKNPIYYVHDVKYTNHSLRLHLYITQIYIQFGIPKKIQAHTYIIIVGKVEFSTDKQARKKAAKFSPTHPRPRNFNNIHVS